MDSIKENPTNTAVYAVQRNCPFDELSYFDVTKGLPPDVMHDLLEGVMPLLVKLVLCKAHREKHITIQEINAELSQFAIGQNDRKNKPSQLSEKILQNSSISGSASQKWCLFSLLPFLIAHCIPPNSNYWNVYLLCRDIADILMAPTVKRESLPILDLKVNKFLQELKDEFDVITPKCHYLIHYARLISSYGPLHLLWCMRFESKNLNFKNVSSTCRNFINIVSSLSKRHQFKQCWEFSSGSMLGDYEKVTGTSVSTPFTSLHKELQNTLKSHKKCGSTPKGFTEQ